MCVILGLTYVCPCPKDNHLVYIPQIFYNTCISYDFALSML